MAESAGPLLALLVLVLVSAVAAPSFIVPENLGNVARQLSIIGIVGVGMTFVILTGGIDLSVGAIVGLSAVVAATTLKSGGPAWIAVFLGLGVGTGIGFINGLGITAGRLQPFITTLAMLGIARGVALAYSNGQPIVIGQTDAAQAFTWLGAGDVFGLPTPSAIFLLVVAVSAAILRWTHLGRFVYAIGGNSETARLAGIHVGHTKMAVYVISGFLAGLAAVILCARVTVGDPTAGTNYELDAIATVVVGGTSLFGGIGSVWGTLLGALIIGVLANTMNLLEISPYVQMVTKGAIIVAAVLLGRLTVRE